MIVAYIKPTNFCGVGCDHCYLPAELRADKSRMSFDVLRKTGLLLKDMAVAQKAPGILVIWHGGEVLTLNPQWFEEAGKILDEVIPGHFESFQTSLMPFTGKWADLIHRRYRGVIGSSIDFSSRSLKGSTEEYQRHWMDRVKAARELGIKIIPGTVPSTAEISRPRELVQWMIDNGFSEFNIERYNAYGAKLPNHPTNRQHANFLAGVFDAVMEMEQKATGSGPSINVIRAVIGGVLYETPGDRWGGSCQSDFVVVEPDGSLNNCPDKAAYDVPYGNVANGFDDFKNSEPRRKWIRIQAVGHKQGYCASCENNSWCASGCPITTNNASEHEDCSGYKTFINHVRKALLDENVAAAARSYFDRKKSPFGMQQSAVSPPGYCVY